MTKVQAIYTCKLCGMVIHEDLAHGQEYMDDVLLVHVETQHPYSLDDNAPPEEFYDYTDEDIE